MSQFWCLKNCIVKRISTSTILRALYFGCNGCQKKIFCHKLSLRTIWHKQNQRILPSCNFNGFCSVRINSYQRVGIVQIRLVNGRCIVAKKYRTFMNWSQCVILMDKLHHCEVSSEFGGSFHVKKKWISSHTQILTNFRLKKKINRKPKHYLRLGRPNWKHFWNKDEFKIVIVEIYNIFKTQAHRSFIMGMEEL